MIGFSRMEWKLAPFVTPSESKEILFTSFLDEKIILSSCLISPFCLRFQLCHGADEPVFFPIDRGLKNSSPSSAFKRELHALLACFLLFLLLCCSFPESQERWSSLIVVQWIVFSGKETQIHFSLNFSMSSLPVSFLWSSFPKLIQIPKNSL